MDERGRFLNWSCCGGKDPDPFSFCGKWTGHGLKRIPGTICQHASFKLTTTYFSVIHPNGSTTTLDDFYLPVDRFVYVTASFDGSYLRIYMNGELLSAKCTENILDQKKNQSPKKKVNQNKSGVAVGEGFIGMVSYVRLWDKTLTSRELLASMHPYFSNAQNNGTKSTLNVIDVLVPQNRGTNPNLVLDLPICDATSFTRVPFVAISSSGKATKGGAALQGQFSFIVRPPLYVGAKRTVARMASRNKFGWPSFHKLCGELRNNGMITITIFRNATNSTGLNAANQILKSIAVQLFAQDWAVRQIHSEQEEKEEHLTITFTYFDVDGVEHVSDLYFEDNDEESILESVEAVVRSATTKTDRMVHQHLRNTFRSSLWSLEFGSGHAEMTFKQIFRSLEKVTTGKSLEELMVSQHVMLPKKQTKASTRLTQVQFTEGLWVAGMIAHMPEIIECARQLGNRMVQYRAVEVEPNSFSSPESSNTVEDSSGRTLDLDNGVLSTRSQLELNTMVDLAPDRLISYSVTAEWNTHTITNPQAALEISATMDVLCVALDERNIPLETINVTNVDSEDNAVRCGANDHQKNHHSPIQLFKEFENTTTHSVTRSLTFEFDLNLTMSNVKTFALVLGSNGSEQNNVFDAVGDVVVSVHRITHDEQSYQQMAFEQRRKSGGTKSAMEGTSNLNAKVYKTDSMGIYRQDCHGPHSAMVLCVFERVQHTKWGFRLSYAKLQNTVCPFEHVMRTAQLLRLLLSNRKQRVTILYCDGCEHHQKTSWHMPGQFKNMFECIRVLLKRLMPSLLVFGQPVTNAVGSFEVYFTPFEGGAVQLLYSALRQRGWLPTPELIAEKVQRAIKDLHWNRPATAGTLTLNSMVKEYENKHDTNDKNTSDTNVLRFVIRDAVTEQTLRSVPIYIFCVDTFDDITYAHKCIKTIRATKAAGLPPPTLKSSEYCVTTAYTNGRGRGEVPLQVGRTYAVHVELQGYYPIEIVALKWSQVSTTTKTTTSKHHHGSGGSSSTAKGAGQHRSLGNSTLRVITLMPRIERVNICITDLETSEMIEADGITTSLVNRRTAVRHTTKSNIKGMNTMHVPRGIYRIDVSAPTFDKIPYALTSDKKAMSFIETAASFDKARRDAANKVKDTKLVVENTVNAKFGIPSMRWPWHFTVMDGATGKLLKGARCTVRDKLGNKIFSAVTSKDGTTFGMLELGKADYCEVTMLGNASTTAAMVDYLPFRCNVVKMQRKRKKSPLLLTCTLCPQPKRGYARAVLIWKRRCWNDFHLYIKSDDANSCFHVWKRDPVCGGANHDLISRNGQSPTSFEFRLLPNAQYRFQIIQYGSFQMNKETMFKLNQCGLELLVFDHHGIVLHEKHPVENDGNGGNGGWSPKTVNTDGTGKIIKSK